MSLLGPYDINHDFEQRQEGCIVNSGSYIISISCCWSHPALPFPKGERERCGRSHEENDTLADCHPDPNVTKATCEARE